MAGQAHQGAGLSFFFIHCYYDAACQCSLEEVSGVTANAVGGRQISPGLIRVTDYPIEDKMGPNLSGNFSMQTELRTDGQGCSLINLICFPKESPNLCPTAC